MKWNEFYSLLISAINQKAESLLIETREGEVIIDLRNKEYYDLVGWDKDGYFWKDSNYNAVLQKYQRVSYYKAFEPCGHFHRIVKDGYKEIVILDAVMIF